MRIYQLFNVPLLIILSSLLSACLGDSLPLTEEEKQNLALLNAVNSDKQNTNKTDKNIQLSLLNAHQVEEKPEMTFKLVLTKAAKEDISVSIHLDTRFTHQDAQATENVDFSLPNLTSISIPAGKTATQFKVQVLDDKLIEATEQFKLVVSNLKTKDGSVKLLKTAATGTILDNEVWRGPLNDTGIDFGADVNTGNNTDCTGTEIAAQDCAHGLDADSNQNSNNDGRLGFSFTKLDANGQPLPNSATTWSCVKDNRTGLIWEVKTADVPRLGNPAYKNPKYLHDKLWRYSSFDLRYLDGEYEGQNVTGKKGLTQEQLYGKDKVYAGNIDIPVYRKFNGNLWSNGSNACANKKWVCTTHQYTLDVNQGKGLCGFRDWRIPTAIEAETIVDYSGNGLDRNFFPYNVGFWTKTPFMDNNKIQHPSKGVITYLYEENRKYYFLASSRNSAISKSTSIRLVRSQQTNSYTPENHGYGKIPKPANSQQTYNAAIPASTPTADFEFIPNTHGVLDTVKHLPTGLIWKRCPEQFELSNQGTPKPEDDTCNYTGTNPYISPNWQGILANVPTGWRVPNIKELKSLIEFNKSRPSINLVVFPNHLSTYCNNVRFSMEAFISLYSSSPSKQKEEFPTKPGKPFEAKSVVHAYSFMARYSRLNKYDKLVLNSYDFSYCNFTRLVKDN